jgi:hypothetical protein
LSDCGAKEGFMVCKGARPWFTVVLYFQPIYGIGDSLDLDLVLLNLILVILDYCNLSWNYFLHNFFYLLAKFGAFDECFDFCLEKYLAHSSNSAICYL